MEKRCYYNPICETFDLATRQVLCNSNIERFIIDNDQNLLEDED